MADYNDGSRFGGDVISPYDDIGLSFEQVQLPAGPMLLSRNEMPRLPVELPAQMDEISQKSLTRRIEGFTGARALFGWSTEDHQLLIMFLLIVVIVMQVRLMWHHETPRHYDGGGPQVHYFMPPQQQSANVLSPLTFGPQQ